MKRLLFISTIMLCSIICNAQLGVQGGANFAKLKIAHRGYVYTEDVSSSRTGLIAGFVFQTPIIKHLDFRPELNYIQKGGKFYIINRFNRFGKFTSVNDARFDYLQLALNTIYTVNVGIVSLFAGAGLDCNLGIGGKVKADQFNEPTSNGPPYSSYKEYKQTSDYSFGVLFIAGMKLKNGIFTSVNYSKGNQNVNDFSTKDEYGIIKTQDITIKLGYFLPKKHALNKRSK